MVLLVSQVIESLHLYLYLKQIIGILSSFNILQTLLFMCNFCFFLNLKRNNTKGEARNDPTLSASCDKGPNARGSYGHDEQMLG